MWSIYTTSFFSNFRIKLHHRASDLPTSPLCELTIWNWTKLQSSMFFSFFCDHKLHVSKSVFGFPWKCNCESFSKEIKTIGDKRSFDVMFVSQRKCVGGDCFYTCERLWLVSWIATKVCICRPFVLNPVSCNDRVIPLSGADWAAETGWLQVLGEKLTGCLSSSVLSLSSRGRASCWSKAVTFTAGLSVQHWRRPYSLCQMLPHSIACRKK